MDSVGLVCRLTYGTLIHSAVLSSEGFAACKQVILPEIEGTIDGNCQVLQVR